MQDRLPLAEDADGTTDCLYPDVDLYEVVDNFDLDNALLQAPKLTLKT